MSSKNTKRMLRRLRIRILSKIAKDRYNEQIKVSK